MCRICRPEKGCSCDDVVLICPSSLALQALFSLRANNSRYHLPAALFAFHSVRVQGSGSVEGGGGIYRSRSWTNYMNRENQTEKQRPPIIPYKLCNTLDEGFCLLSPLPTPTPHTFALSAPL